MPKQFQRILVIDDEVAFRSIYSNFLSHYGFDVLTAVDGEDGIRKIESNRPDIILTDIDMPKKDGFEIFTFAKARGIPVLFISGGDINNRNPEQQKILRENTWIQKPASLHKILLLLIELYNAQGIGKVAV